MHFVHKSADPQSVINGTILSAFEFNGQKCSACSRLYVPQSMWPKVKDGMLEALKEVKVGSPLDRRNLVTAVIDDKVGGDDTFLEDCRLVIFKATLVSQKCFIEMKFE